MFFKKNYTDNEIITGLLGRDKLIFRYLDREYAPIINGIVLRNYGSVEDSRVEKFKRWKI